jgi:hypothetical protein
LKSRLLSTKKQVEFKNGKSTGRTYHCSYEKLAEGVEPREALSMYADLLTAARQEGMFFLAHNHSFDKAHLEGSFQHWARHPFRFDNPWEVLDTGAIEKASQVNMVPWVGEAPAAWAARVSNQRLAGVYWSLDKACMKRYGLDLRYKLDQSEAHNAGHDCWLTHLLFEEYKSIHAGMFEAPPPSKVRPT